MTRKPALLSIAVLLLVLILHAAGLPPNKETVDHILVLKSKRTMTLLSGDKVLKTYQIALGGTPLGPKERQGDHKTPEGSYIIDSRNAHSQFHLALHVSYPNAEDRARAHKSGVDPGGAIMIHGLPAGYGWLGANHRRVDWTDGCIAVSNEEIEEIWKLVPIGARVEIKP